MIYKYFLKKVVGPIFVKISQGDVRGLWSYIKKAALGLVIGLVIMVTVLVTGFIFFIQFIISLF